MHRGVKSVTVIQVFSNIYIYIFGLFVSCYRTDPCHSNSNHFH